MADNGATRSYNEAYTAFVRNHGFVSEETLLTAHAYAAKVAAKQETTVLDCDGCGNPTLCVTNPRDLVIVLHACCNGSNGGAPIC